MKLLVPRIRGLSVLFAVAILAASAVAAHGATRYDRHMTQQVLSKMHHVNQMEIRMGELAMQKGRSQDVRNFGRRLRNDHQMADRRVTNLAAREGIRLVNRPMTPHERSVHRRLRHARGDRFDREFMNDMASGHTQTIQDLAQARRELRDPQVRRLVGNTLPALRQHRNMAREIQQNL
jgi:putative membrane protein